MGTGFVIVRHLVDDVVGVPRVEVQVFGPYTGGDDVLGERAETEIAAWKKDARPRVVSVEVVVFNTDNETVYYSRMPQERDILSSILGF
jgi:hypothetical protein